MEEKGMDMAKLSRRSDVSYNTVQKLTKDDTEDVKLSTLEQLAKALGVSTHELFEEIAEDAPPQK